MKRIVIILLIVLAGCEARPKTGEIWRYQYSNPFDPYMRDYRVIDVKGRYIQYVNIANNDTQTNTISYFLLDSKRIK